MDTLAHSAARPERTVPLVPLHIESLADATHPPLAWTISEAATQVPKVSFQIVLNDLFIFFTSMGSDVSGGAVLVLP
nr:hypothetical protein [Cupriavidus nantongensis]